MQANLTNDLIRVYMYLPQKYFLSTIDTRVCYQHPYFSPPSFSPSFVYFSFKIFICLLNGGEGIEMPEHFQTGPCRAWGTPDASPPYLSLYLSLPPSPLSCPPTPPTK